MEDSALFWLVTTTTTTTEMHVLFSGLDVGRATEYSRKYVSYIVVTLKMKLYFELLGNL